MKYRWIFVYWALFVLTTGCYRDGNVTKLQYVPDMADSPTVKPQQDYLDPPEGSVAWKSLIYPKTREESEALLTNKLRGSKNEDKHLQKGKEIWRYYCYTCHGTEGKGDGPITTKYPKPPDITTKDYYEKKDGYYFHTITWGIRLMWGYGHSISPQERWQVILHLRKLQEAAL